MLHPVVSFCACKRINLAPHRIPAQLALADTWQVIITKLFVRDSLHRNRVMGLSLPVRRNVRPLISVMPDQIITHPVRHHDLNVFKIHIFHRKHHVLVKKERASSPAHCIARTVGLLIRIHDLLQLLQCTVFSQKGIGKQPPQIGCHRDFPTGTVYHYHIYQLRVDHHMGTVFLIFLIVSWNGIQSQHINDLTCTVPSYDLVLMQSAAVRSNISGKCIGVIPIHIHALKGAVLRKYGAGNLHQFVPVVSWHIDIHVVVPGNKALVSHNANGSPSCHYISQIILFTDFIQLTEKLQQMFLFLCHWLSSLVYDFQNVCQCL